MHVIIVVIHHLIPYYLCFHVDSYGVETLQIATNLVFAS